MSWEIKSPKRSLGTDAPWISSPFDPKVLVVASLIDGDLVSIEFVFAREPLSSGLRVSRVASGGLPDAAVKPLREAKDIV
jgi:hypothetical protein